ncbi:MAG: TlpA disulfide reductase family protein [Bacteroidia bacterium]|nr:TlpA family protein disulfide reductase [Bacteroidia bacterium]MDW8159325.1 TlpA disulfide reductase family protein [Bacteroidia bacterium]
MPRAVFLLGSVLLVFLMSLAACEQQTSSEGYTVEGKLYEVDQVNADTIGIYEFVSGNFVPIKKVALEKEGKEATFVIRFNPPDKEGYYWLALQISPPSNDGVFIYFGSTKSIELEANARNLLGSTSFKNSSQSEAVRYLISRIEQFKQSLQQASQKKQPLDSLYLVQDRFLDSVSLAMPQLKPLVSTYRSVPRSEIQGAAEEQYRRFSEAYFKTIDFSQPMIGYFPAYFNKVYNYIFILVSEFYADHLSILKEVNNIWEKIPSKSRNAQAFLDACIFAAANAFSQTQNPELLDLYLDLAEKYALTYPEAKHTVELKKNLETYGKVRIGKIAPEINLTTPEGKSLALSSLRGKVVLIDFWASWCKPCRMENPNVVRVYQLYKNKGFEVFSVSLDQEKAAWQAAIQQDGLVWPNHVSDLKGFESAAAKSYGVTGIPFTVLIDREGRIVAKNLRGAALEKALAKIFANAT